MSRQLKLETHLTIEELEKGYRRAVDGRERSHWQMIWLLAQGKSTAEVAHTTGYSVPWVRTIVHRYNAQGAVALSDTRHTNPGRGHLLNAEQEARLKALLYQAEADEEPWTGIQVASWMSQEVGRRLNPARGWDILHRWGFTRKGPRPRHIKADLQAQSAFKKT